MIRVVGDRMEVSGPMLMSGASALLAEGETAVAATVVDVDLGGVTEMDSSSLAVLFAWMRTAKAGGKALRLLNPPQNLLNLAAVYGVAELLPQH